LSQNEKSANTRPPAPTAQLKQTAICGAQSVRAKEYLQSVVRKGQLDFIPQERMRPVAFPFSSIKLIAERASFTLQVPHEIRGQRSDAHTHWGLNE
jgi:hypothetical protein